MKPNNQNVKKTAGYFFILIFVAITIFHLFVLSGIVPYSIVWGGRLTNQEEMYRFEFVSIVLNSFFIWIALIKTGNTKPILPQKAISVILWIMAVLFSINTIGNIVSQNDLERIIFTPITAILAILCAFLAKD
ncbi:hypothetical protein [Leptospira kmetyi]|uniref:Uncharacterized protein n=1 Tax=Leptospira kmetyi TaxID=408139 RepID=A0A2M9XV61_9LEPT|nr:hypothetical protein [Leptospira kmetyi]AYV57149.1 hypothetical protein EFP84_17630 [Leptospira kmetyi]EQA52475.1 hypothetical protein LEP1GSC052_1760 [Leptospira kmetyi serovar Malaysia str. Bejo-Iso9]PJZ31868.1 hypothetical protein CH378_01270 [Leptospira kmetyi]PJZ43184.1 hypothetical protein CH370_01785 [Leptospira kmetyi]TGK21488.1 hypothetical protein EHO62_03495 [Leptospira kmetyi]